MFETTFVYNNKDIQHTDQGFEAYHRFHSGRQTMYHQLDDDFCIVHFRKDLRVHNKSRLQTKCVHEGIDMFSLILWKGF